MYTLYWSKDTGAMAPQFLLEELGLEYSLVATNTFEGRHRDADYLALNPMAQVPTLVLPDGQVMTETAAMVLYLADLHPSSGLAPSPSSAARAPFLRWLMFMVANTYEADLRWSYPERFTTQADAIASVAEAARRDAWRYFDVIEAALEPGPFLLGTRFSAIDCYLLMLAGWHFDVAKLRADCPRIAALVDRSIERPAIAHVWAQHKAD